MFQAIPQRMFLVRELDHSSLRLVENNPCNQVDWEHIYSAAYEGTFYPIDTVHGYFHDEDLNKWVVLNGGIGFDENWVDTIEHATKYRKQWIEIKKKIEQYIQSNPTKVSFYVEDAEFFPSLISDVNKPMKLIRYEDRIFGIVVDAAKLPIQLYALEKKDKQLALVIVNEDFKSEA